MFASKRTEVQVALLIVGMIVWGYGSRADVEVLKYTGIGFFAAATVLRLLKKKDPNPAE
jgi:hypothetical protein